MSDRNDCVYCENEDGTYCAHYCEKIARGGYVPPGASGQAQRGQDKCPGFVLSERMRESWEEKFG